MNVYVYAFLDSLFFVHLRLHRHLHSPRLCLSINSIFADQLLAHLLVQSAGRVRLDHIQVNLVSQQLLYQNTNGGNVLVKSLMQTNRQ